MPNSTLPATDYAEASLPEFLGNNHRELSEWLSQTWLKAGPPVCFVEGFSGVGKTSLARNLRQHSNDASVMVNMPEAGLDQIDNLLLDLATELDIIGHTEMADAVNAGTPLSTALEKVLRKPVLIVVDEFQNALDASGKLTNALKPLLEKIANRLTFPGRLLLLSNQRLERGKWLDPYAIQSLSSLEPEAAIQLLDRLLIKAKRSTEVPLERRHDVVNWLGCNPRAIGVLVTSLEEDSLDDLIGLSPDIWDMRDREVSPELIHHLERELLERTLSHLQAEANQLLQQLSVYRKAVKREAFEKHLPPTVELAAIARDLMSRFLMEQHNGWFTLNPVVKEISLQRLKKSPSAFQRAHGRAADYYTRHFTAKNIVGSGQLGGYFVEARYHLVQSNRTNDLSQITGRFENHLKATYTSVSPIPKEAHELSERIAVLSALLETPGSKGLEYYLARLLQARGAPGDLPKALVYAQRATSPSAPADSWLLRIRLEAQLNGTERALQVCRESLHFVPPTQNLFSLYQGGAKLLAQSGRTEEAISLLKDGIARIPPTQSLFSLYQSRAELLAQAGRFEEAISLLKDGITHIPPTHGLVALFESGGAVLAQVGRVEEAISLLKEGISRIPPALGLVALYQSGANVLTQAGRVEEAITFLKDGIGHIPYGRNNRYRLIETVLFLIVATHDITLLESLIEGSGSMVNEPQQMALGRILLAQLQGDWRRAAEIAQQSTMQFPKYFALFTQEAFSWLCVGEAKAADEALRHFLLQLKLDKGQPNAWLKALIAVKNGDLATARESLSIYLGQILDEQQGVTLDMLLQLWDTPAKTLADIDIAFYYPTLPAILTGLPHDVTRIEYGPSVLHLNIAPLSKTERIVPDI